MTTETSANSQQLAYVHRRLIIWRDELATTVGKVTPDLKNATTGLTPSPSQERAKKLLSKIDEALTQIEAGTYGAGRFA